MKIPIVDKALAVMAFLNGIGTSSNNFEYQGMSSTDIATLRQVNVR